MRAARTLDAAARLARSIAWLFDPILYPELNLHIEITQGEIGVLSSVSLQNAKHCLKQLEREGLLRFDYGRGDDHGAVESYGD